MQHPRGVISRMQLGQQISQDNVVHGASQGVQAKQVQDRNRGRDLQGAVQQAVMHDLIGEQMVAGTVVRLMHPAASG